MFENINDVLSDTSTLVCVLIDEIESLAHTRESCMSGMNIVKLCKDRTNDSKLFFII